ncbi:MAG: hypothetical protein V2I36_17775 [Desulfopila sp.]|jgi:hypothetical protein|nr:hypothetical protein [Desulfopila sp.]
MSKNISPSKKVNLLLRNEDSETGIHEEPGRVFSFIYGVAGNGLVPFELTVAGKAVGDTFILHLTQEELQPFFAHLFRPFMRHLDTPALPLELHFTVTVLSVEDPDEREIVKAMAAAVGGGCHGGCDCGCH